MHCNSEPGLNSAEVTSVRGAFTQAASTHEVGVQHAWLLAGLLAAASFAASLQAFVCFLLCQQPVSAGQPIRQAQGTSLPQLGMHRRRMRRAASCFAHSGMSRACMLTRPQAAQQSLQEQVRTSPGRRPAAVGTGQAAVQHARREA